MAGKSAIARQGAKSGHLCDLHDRRGGRSMARPRRAQQHLADQAICTCANRDRRSSTSEHRSSARSVLRGVDEAFADRGSLSYSKGLGGCSAMASTSMAGSSPVPSFRSEARCTKPAATVGSFVVFAMRSNSAAASRANWFKRDPVGHPTLSRRGMIQGSNVRSEFRRGQSRTSPAILSASCSSMKKPAADCSARVNFR